MKKKKRIAILISGEARNMRELVKATADPDFPAETTLVLSNEPAALGLEWAQAHEVPTAIICHRDFESDEAFEKTLHKKLTEKQIDFLCFSGFRYILSNTFIDKWSHRILAVHPSLLPSFPVMNPAKAALQAGVKVTGATCYFVTDVLFNGVIISQTPVFVEPGDTEETLGQRIQKAEEQLFPISLRRVAEERIRITGTTTSIIERKEDTNIDLMKIEPSLWVARRTP